MASAHHACCRAGHHYRFYDGESMTTKSELLALAERVEAGTGADTDLDRDIALATGLEEIRSDYDHTPERLYSQYRRYDEHGNSDTGAFYVMIGRVTSSVDAVEALRERLLPESRMQVVLIKDYVSCGISFGGPPEYSKNLQTSAKTEPRGRVAALLRAYAGGM